MLPNMMGGKMRIIGITIGCCLLAAAPGCLFRHTGEQCGFFGHSSNCKHASSSASLSADDPDASQAGKDTEASEGSNHPELLPWRSRPKGGPLGGLLGRIKERTSETVAARERPAEDHQQSTASTRSFSESDRPDLAVD
jgi:hypothetical protein